VDPSPDVAQHRRDTLKLTRCVSLPTFTSEEAEHPHLVRALRHSKRVTRRDHLRTLRRFGKSYGELRDQLGLDRPAALEALMKKRGGS